MIELVKRLFGRPAPPRCFSYWDGSRTRVVDPLVVAERVNMVAPALAAVLDRPGPADPVDAAIDQGLLVAEVRRIFELEEFRDDGGGAASGLTRAETLAVAKAFLRFCATYRG